MLIESWAEALRCATGRDASRPARRGRFFDRQNADPRGTAAGIRNGTGYLDSTQPNRDALFPSIEGGDLIRNALATLRRRWLTPVAFTLLAVALSFVYVGNATPMYTANGSLLIDPRFGQMPDAGGAMTPALLSSDALTVDSEIRVLTSRDVTTRTMKRLKLTADVPDSPSVPRRIAEQLRLRPVTPEAPGLSPDMRRDRRVEAQRRAFMRGLDVERSGDSFVIDVSYTTPRADLAPVVVNTLMEEYLAASGSKQTRMMERRRAWLSDRIDEVGQALTRAETAVATYRQTHRLLAPEGQLLPSEMALNAANGQLVRLRSAALAKQVQLAQLSERIAAGDIDAVRIPPEERTQTLDQFEATYAVVLREEKELRMIRGDSAPMITPVRQRKVMMEDLIIGEYHQILDNLTAQAEALERETDATERMITGLTQAYARDIAKSVDLRGLEREATVKRELYERLLEEYDSAAQLVSFDSSSARVIAQAVTPDTTSSPRARRVVLLAVIGALILSLGWIALMEVLDNRLRRDADVTDGLGLPLLGVIPTFRSDRRAARARGSRPMPLPAAPAKLSRATRRYQFATRWPTSLTSETMRRLHSQLAADRGARDQGLIFGVTSAVRDEGKTTTAMNLGCALSAAGEEVAVVDLDLVARTLSTQIRSLLRQTNHLDDVIRSPETAPEGLVPSPEFSGTTIIGTPRGTTVRRYTPRDFDDLEAGLTALRRRYSYVIVDLPPVLGVADTIALSRLCDGTCLVAAWGKTPREQVAAALAQLDRDRCLGLLFTRAKLSAYRSYNAYTLPRDGYAYAC